MKKGLAILILMGVFSTIDGCRKEDRAVLEVERDMQETLERLATPRPDSMLFGNRLAVKISQLPDRRQREKYRDMFEKIVFSTRFSSENYLCRVQQLNVFCELAGNCVYTRQLLGEDVSSCVKTRLKILDRLSREWCQLSEDGGRKSGDVLGIHLNAEGYGESVKKKLDKLAEGFESRFNEIGLELAESQRTTIRKEFASIMGRPLRTEEEIAYDRQRRIDTQTNEARRHQEERLGNDVRVDIDSL